MEQEHQSLERVLVRCRRATQNRRSGESRLMAAGGGVDRFHTAVQRAPVAGRRRSPCVYVVALRVASSSQSPFG